MIHMPGKKRVLNLTFPRGCGVILKGTSFVPLTGLFYLVRCTFKVVPLKSYIGGLEDAPICLTSIYTNYYNNVTVHKIHKGTKEVL